MVKNIKFFESNNKSKKYRVEFTHKGKEYKINFGQRGYPQYKDSTPLKLYSKLDHMDKARRKRFLNRTRGIKNKQGELNNKNTLYANY